MPNSPITGPCTDPHFADPGQTSPPTWLGACAGTRRPRLNVSVQLPSATGQSDENSGHARSGKPGQLTGSRGKSGRVNAVKGPKGLGTLATSCRAAGENSYAPVMRRVRKGRSFPNCTALNHAELPPPLLSRRGQFDELFVTGVTDGNNRSSDLFSFSRRRRPG